MKLLLDTCALSELQRPAPHTAMSRLIDESNEADLFLSVISMGEIIKGVRLMPAGKRQQQLDAWVVELERSHADRILPIDGDTARIWGELTATAQKSGHPLPMADGLIAATAHRHGLHLVTRNTPNFEYTGVLLLNPWAED